ncbi:hypothetical protein SPHINGO361_140241 [Sphingomonas sp. EC-HK361]|nr:hypothetical protein SPHINGO361_140241 [Sphingomonas sp. EC-HK361]
MTDGAHVFRPVLDALVKLLRRTVAWLYGRHHKITLIRPCSCRGLVRNARHQFAQSEPADCTHRISHRRIQNRFIVQR